MKVCTTIEALEPRIAPAAVTITGKTATWTDVDGDLVTMKWTSNDAPDFTTQDKGLGLVVTRVLLDPVKHAGASFTVSVKQGGVFGDGRVELGHLDGTGVALKGWNGAKAGLSEIDLGDGTIGIGTLVTGGYGQTKIDFFANAMGNGQGRIDGSTKMVKINGDMGYGSLQIGTSPSGQTHGTVTVTGSLRGDITSDLNDPEGLLLVWGSGKSIMVQGSVLNGQLDARGQMKTVTIGGDVVGRDPYPSGHGEVNTNADAFVLKGSLLGGSIYVSYDQRPLKTVTVGGSIVARDGVQQSGQLSVNAGQVTLKSLTVKGNVVGGQFSDWVGSQTATAVGAGVVMVDGSVDKITIGGSIHAGTIATDNKAVNGGITVSGNLGTLTVGGGIYGYDADPAFILVSGLNAGNLGNPTAIQKVVVKRDMSNAYISAGTSLNYTMSGQPYVMLTAGDFGIGAVSVGGNFINSNILAGVNDTGALGVNPNNAFDTLVAGDPGKVARIGAVVIKGFLLSDYQAVTVAGFAAEEIASIVVNGRQVFKAGDGLRNFDTYLTAKEL